MPGTRTIPETIADLTREVRRQMGIQTVIANGIALSMPGLAAGHRECAVWLEVASQCLEKAARKLPGGGFDADAADDDQTPP